MRGFLRDSDSLDGGADPRGLALGLGCRMSSLVASALVSTPMSESRSSYSALIRRNLSQVSQMQRYTTL